jgi:hypothetical protein
MYCRNVDGMGYCCTSSIMPNKLLCETHADINRQSYFPFLTREAAYVRTSGVGVSPMTVAASEAAIKALKDTDFKPFVPGGGGGGGGAVMGRSTLCPGITENPITKGPPPLKKLGEQLKTSPFFKNISEHYGTDTWVDLLQNSVAVRGNFYLKQLALYVSDKLGIDSEDATAFTSDDSNIRILASAGVKLMFLVCELLARNALWDRVPYLRYLLEQKHALGSEEHKKAKCALVDALSLFEENEPKVFGDTYSGLFMKAQLALQHSLPKDIGVYPLSKTAVPDLTPKEIVADMMRNMLSRAAGLPDPDPVSDPQGVAAVVVSNLKAVDTKFRCAEKSATTITEACWEWIDKQLDSAPTIPSTGTLAEYAAIATKLLPTFVAVFSK